jgi:hypothetical protein
MSGKWYWKDLVATCHFTPLIIEYKFQKLFGTTAGAAQSVGQFGCVPNWGKVTRTGHASCGDFANYSDRRN